MLPHFKNTEGTMPLRNTQTEQIYDTPLPGLTRANDLWKYPMKIHTSFLGYVIGKNGSTIDRIQKETQTKLNISTSSKSNSKIMIEAHDEGSIRDAKEQIEIIIENNFSRLPWTHFISVPFTSHEIIQRISDFNLLLKTNFVGRSNNFDESLIEDPLKKHVTLFMLKLYGEEQIEKARKCLDESKPEIEKILTLRKSVSLKGLDIMNDDPSMARVLFAKVEDGGIIQQIYDVLVKHFQSANLYVDQPPLKIHSTLAKSSLRQRKALAVSVAAPPTSMISSPSIPSSASSASSSASSTAAAATTDGDETDCDEDESALILGAETEEEGDTEEDEEEKSKPEKKAKKDDGVKTPKKPTKTFSTGIDLNQPIRPMLCKAVKSLEEVLKKFPDGFFSEIKYDGERIQIHKSGSGITCYSRSLKPIQPWKVEEVKDYIPMAINAPSCILDGEILLMDVKKRLPLPFGTLGTHKKNKFADATVCVFVFDILFLNGTSLMCTPICKRRKLLESVLKVIPNRVEISELNIINEESDLCNMMTRVIQEKLEGLVVKGVNSIYEPSARHWLKIKKDHLSGMDMADTADLMVLGGFYGKGSHGGTVHTFLMGCYDDKDKKFKTVCKVGTGFDDSDILRLQTQLVPHMTRIDKDFDKVPPCIDLHRQDTPDWVFLDPKKAPVWEIAGAEFSKSNRHTADSISIRFPRVIRERGDKDFSSHTTLALLHELKDSSTAHLSIKSAKPGAKSPAITSAAPVAAPAKAAPKTFAKPAVPSHPTAESSASTSATSTASATTSATTHKKLPDLSLPGKKNTPASDSAPKSKPVSIPATTSAIFSLASSMGGASAVPAKPQVKKDVVPSSDSSKSSTTTTTTTTTTMTTTDIAVEKAEKRKREEMEESARIAANAMPAVPVPASVLTAKPFKGMRFVFSGAQLQARPGIKAMAEELGAVISTEWSEIGNKASTHLICSDETPLYSHVYNLGGLIVKPGWILTCHKSKKHFNEMSYIFDPKEQPSEPFKILKDLPEIFHSGMKFWLCCFEFESEECVLKRYLVAHGGHIASSIEQATCIIVGDSEEQLATCHDDLATRKVYVVSSQWAWDSINGRTRMKESAYRVL
eukprot:TRINITY_DN2263_c0_g1_i2.p1 TRINITY_DN2263_c0_g1~~TRINITY_DN2263_c0_g1_i2.p1  ORF type:complete len:1105 (+),score=388.13 TRINITY_DN2263_c0_g1_i2:81-3395(+)